MEDKNIVHAWGIKVMEPARVTDTPVESVINDKPAYLKDHEEDVTTGCCRSRFTVFSDETSFHGIKHISGENKRSRRIAWMIILFLALIGLIYQLNVSVNRFLDFPSNTNLKYVTKSSIKFPKVTLCNINMFKFDDVTPLMGGYALFYEHGLNYLRSIMPEIGITSDGKIFSIFENHTDYPGNYDLQDFIRYNGHKIKDMLDVCIFNGMECGSENFTLTFTNYGACYVFTPSTPMHIKNTGQRYGLSLILNVEHLQYITAPRENVGFRVAIECHHDAPNIEASGVDIGTGSRVSIGLRKQTLVTLPPPHGTCIPSGSGKLKYFQDAPYTQSRCYLECETDYFMNACQCRTFYTPGDEVEQPFCSSNNLTKCYIPKYEEFIANREDYCNCKEACFAENFIKSNSFSSFPSRGVPQTFYVTNQYKYYALALGFNIKQAMANEKNVICEKALAMGEQFATDTFIKTQFPAHYAEAVIGSVYGEKMDALFALLTYDLIYFTTDEISDMLFYDLITDEQNLTAVNTDFYNITYYKAHQNLNSQMGGMIITLVTAIQELFPSSNYTDEDASLFIDVFLTNVYIYVYPEILESCCKIADSLYKNDDLAYLTRHFMQDNLARVDIYFESFKVEEITEQKAYEFFSIVCDLGGALGLFFGASLVAFVEAIDFWVIRGCLNRRTK